MAKTKIVATLGPASSDEKVIKELIEVGVNLFRFNFSHGTHEEHLDKLNLVNKIIEENGYIIGKIADLQGPKIRIGDIEGSCMMLESDSEVFVKNVKLSGEKGILPIPYPNLYTNCNPEERLFINDGLVQLIIKEKIDSDTLKCFVKAGGKVTDHKGVNLPDTKLNASALTEKDLRDIEFIKQHDFDYVALSFVQNSCNVLELKELLKDSKYEIDVIAKIEKSEAIDDIDRIMEVSDAIMVARGDLGIEVPLHTLPGLQKKIIKFATKYRKPVITATQMMESMVKNPIPTRAEVTDVSNAIIDGTDAVMLSAETAVGDYPVETVNFMRMVAESTEKLLTGFETRSEDHEIFDDAAIAKSACLTAKNISAKYIVATTMSSKTAKLISKNRPNTNIIAMSPRMKALRKATLFWGVEMVQCKSVNNTDELLMEVEGLLKDRGCVAEGDLIIITGGLPFHVRGITNFIKISRF
ncbi:pyruvate kinase [bacterium]|nr:pyruvate kinase [bacterium]